MAFQTRFVIRLVFVMSFIIGIIAVIILFFASFIPTQLIVADVIIRDSEKRQLALIEAYSNQFMFFDYPVSAQSDAILGVSFSPNGRFAKVDYQEADDSENALIWDIWGGRVIQLPQGICAESAEPSYRSSLYDNQVVYFGCTESNKTDSYLFNFETNEIRFIGTYNNFNFGKRPTTFTQTSNDGRMVANLDLEKGSLVMRYVDEAKTVELTPPPDPFFMRWHPDNRSLLTLSKNTLARYDIGTQTWETISTELEAYSDPFGTYMIFSPNGEWVILFFSDTKIGETYTVHLPTHQTTHLELASFESDDIPNSIWTRFWWSPNSEWIVVSVQKQGQPQAHLIRPDGTEDTFLTDVLLYAVLWASDSTQFAYSAYSQSKSLRIVSLESPTTPHELKWESEYMRWSPDNEALAFITTQPRKPFDTLLTYLSDTEDEVFLLDEAIHVNLFEFVR